MMSERRKKPKSTVSITARIPAEKRDRILDICEKHYMSYPALSERLADAIIEYADNHPTGEMPQPFKIVSKQEYAIFKKLMDQAEYVLRDDPNETKRAG